jgi:hypothetical protein
MAADRYDYCKIFVNRADEAITMELLATLFGGQFQRHSMELDDVVVDARTNPDAAGEAGDDFVRWPVLIELEAAEPGTSSGGRSMVETVGRILTALWDGDQPAVAACDFEDELPWSGGIKRLRERDW